VNFLAKIAIMRYDVLARLEASMRCSWIVSTRTLGMHAALRGCVAEADMEVDSRCA
jgi:hypothetical protein